MKGWFCVKKSVKLIGLTAVVLCMIGLAVGILLYNGIIWFNNPSMKEYPIRGVDVSAYQGDINWDILAKQDISFAFIKATEGSSFVDEQFDTNFENALKTDLRISAYHFFSYESSGANQAKNYISTVSSHPGILPPVVDVEFYGGNEKNPPDKTQVRKELHDLLSALDEYYGITPIIYATNKSYQQYIQGSFGEYDIWIRDILKKPTLADGHDWKFWQYSHRGRLDGYQGEEKYIDMNVFYGSAEEFATYGQTRLQA